MNKYKKRFREIRRGERGLNRFLKLSRSRSKRKKTNNTSFTINSTIPQLQKHTTAKKKKLHYNHILDLLMIEKPMSFCKHCPPFPKNETLYVPEFFSINRDAEGTFGFLKLLMHYLVKGEANTITIDYAACKKIDLGASICFDVILKSYHSFIEKPNNSHLVPKSIKVKNHNSDINKFLYTVGAFKNINKVNHRDTYPEIETFDLIEGRKNQGTGAKEIHGTKLVEYLEKCLKKMDMSLNQSTMENFGNLFGEVFANAEDHSSSSYRYAIGYFEKKNQREIGEFQFVIFNFGDSIYERLLDEESCKNPLILEEMKELSREYTKKGWWFFRQFEEETLWTLYALQDGVSSVSEHRGNGTIKFIESFFDLKGNYDHDEENSQMILYSGNTKITFDGTYKTAPKDNQAGESHKIIAFNEVNTLNEPPNKKFVTFVPNYFPGTMIYAKIFIKPENLRNNV